MAVVGGSVGAVVGAVEGCVEVGGIVVTVVEAEGRTVVLVVGVVGIDPVVDGKVGWELISGPAVFTGTSTYIEDLCAGS